MNFFTKYKKYFIGIGIVLAVYILYFHNIWAYKLMDVDETRYIDMARRMFYKKDFLTLYLNGEYFFEKPPLYFWLESLSFAIFRTVSEWSGRIPISIQSLLAAVAVYFVSAKVVSKKFGLMAALILATGLEFIILSKVAMLDMLLTSCITISTFSGLMTFFAEEKHKKYFWWIFYIFSGLAVMAKGIPGFVVPFGVMFFCGLYTKQFKQFFKPIFFIPGIILFSAIVLPWHIVMFNLHDPLFFNEYIMKHHIARFLGSDVINRERPFYFYFLAVLWGFFPWIFSFFAMLFDKLKGVRYKSYDELSKTQKYITLNIIGAIFTFAFFTSSGTKLITYILPLYPFLAVILAGYWNDEKSTKSFKISCILLNFVLLLTGITAIFIGLFLPEQLYSDIKELQFLAIVPFLIAGLLAVIYLRKNDKTKLFAVYSILMIIMSGFGAHHFFNINYKFGQNDLMNFAEYAKNTQEPIVAFHCGRKYSLLYYSGQDKIKLIGPPDFEELTNVINKNSNIVITARNKELAEINKHINYKIILQGRRYSLIKPENT